MNQQDSTAEQLPEVSRYPFVISKHEFALRLRGEGGEKDSEGTESGGEGSEGGGNS